MDVKSGLLASSTARLPVPQPTSRAFPFARAAANAMKSGASDRLWRPICNSYLSPLEVGKVEFLESSEDCAVVMDEISSEVAVELALQPHLCAGATLRVALALDGPVHAQPFRSGCQNFWQHLFERPSVEHRLRQQLLQPPVLIFQGFQLAGIRHIHAAYFERHLFLEPAP